MMSIPFTINILTAGQYQRNMFLLIRERRFQNTWKRVIFEQELTVAQSIDYRRLNNNQKSYIKIWPIIQSISQWWNKMAKMLRVSKQLSAFTWVKKTPMPDLSPKTNLAKPILKEESFRTWWNKVKTSSTITIARLTCTSITANHSSSIACLEPWTLSIWKFQLLVGIIKVKTKFRISNKTRISTWTLKTTKEWSVCLINT